MLCSEVGRLKVMGGKIHLDANPSTERKGDEIQP
jgi:hypothetical protein